MSGLWNRLWRRRPSFPHEKGEFYHRIAHITGVQPRDLSLYELAVRHSSASRKEDAPSGWSNNERLEFLGDAILGSVVAEDLYNRYPKENEGFLTSMRAKVVSRKNLNRVADAIGVAPLVVSKLDQKKPARSLLGDVLEALIGAIYLDAGMDEARKFITTRIIDGHTEFTHLEKQVVSFKSTFIEHAQACRYKHEFKLEERWGKNHSLNFKVGLYLNGERISEGIGTSKKRAEESAAKFACEELNLLSI